MGKVIIMKKGLIALIVVGVLIVVLVFSLVGTYNSLVSKSEGVKTALSQIDNQLQRRNDLIPNLVNTVKGYASHENEIFTEIADARSRLIGATSVSDRAEADAQVSSALSRLLAISENYPQLKADASFIRLQDELAGTENRISTARKDYNDTAKTYNTQIRRFPAVIFARILGFDSYDYFEAQEGAEKVPGVEF